jgi:hypothetical protein
MPGSVRQPMKMTEILAQVLDGEDETTVGTVVDGISNRGFGFLLTVLALPTLVPVLPPGTATLVGLLYVLLALQMLWGAERPWLPRRIRAYRLPGRIVPKLRVFGVKVFAQLERISRPRALPVPDAVVSRVVASAVLFLGLVLLSPLPFLHTLPGITVLVLGAGLINRDGLLILAGLTLATTSLEIVALSSRLLYLLLRGLWAGWAS